MKKNTLSMTIIKKLIGLSVVVIAIAFFIAYYMTLSIKEDVYHKTESKLQNEISERVESKLSIGATNALSIASNSAIKEALKSGNRQLAIKALNEIVQSFKKETPINDLKLHIHTKDLKSFVREWRVDKYGDDLSSFRHTINSVKENKRLVSALEVGRVGLVLRGIAPVMENGNYLGSVEFIQNYNSIAKKFMDNHEYLLVLTSKKYLRPDKLSKDKDFGDFSVTQKAIDSDFFESAKKIDFDKLKKDGYLIGSKYFYTIVPVYDFQKREVGYYLVGDKLSYVNSAVKEAQKAVYIMILIMFLKTLTVLSALYFVTNRIVGRGVEKFKRYFKEYVDYTTLKSDHFQKAEVYINDEIGELLTLLNDSSDDFKKRIEEDAQVLKELTDVTQEISTGDFSKRIESSSQNILLMRAKENINSMAKELDESMQKVLRVLDSYTNSNYKDKIIIQEKLKAQLKEVMISINKLGITLANSAKESYQKGEALKSEVNTLNSSLTQLVKKSDEQAKSVSKTLKFVQDINELTKNNTKSALSMSELGNRVKSLASKGKELTKSSTKSMDEIDEVTKKISDSIEIIEQISFQINILSLNAAVEAATAGEFGKGFAVVASEVRNLASKTAQASEDIKAIIDDASLKVQEGKINSHNMQEGYSELNSYINETIRLIESVVNSSKEQLSGTEEISQNIDTIEKITKENTKEANRVKEISQNVEVVAIELLERAKESSY